MKVQINMSPELLEMIESQREDRDRSEFICGVLKHVFVKSYFSWDIITSSYPTECPVDIFDDILFDYVNLQWFPNPYNGEDAFGEMCAKWEYEGKYGALKREWFNDSVKVAIEAMEKSKELDEKMKT